MKTRLPYPAFLKQPVELSVARALPCSLIANEVLTNIFKHAFEGRKSGKIKIELSKTDVGGYMRLSISDNGIGLPDNFDPKKSTSLGLTLINMLSEQLPAEHTFTSDRNRTAFTLLFKIGQ